jgi:hypothetical protein
MAVEEKGGRKEIHRGPILHAPAPPDLLANLLRDCGALSEKALLTVSALSPRHFAAPLPREREVVP